MDFALTPGWVEESSGPITCSRGAANTKGSWAQIIAATARVYDAIELRLKDDDGNGGGQTYLVDIGVGAAASEIVIVPNILVDNARVQSVNGQIIIVPISVPSGVRLAARCQEVGGAGTRAIEVSLNGFSGGSQGPMGLGGAAYNYGAVTASSNGTLIDPGATANTYGAWTQLTAATSKRHRWIAAVFGMNQQTGALAGNDWEIQIGVGAGGSEIVIGHAISGFGGTANTIILPNYQRYVDIPEGTRVAARCKCTSNAAGARHQTMVLLAV